MLSSTNQTPRLKHGREDSRSVSLTSSCNVWYISLEPSSIRKIRDFVYWASVSPGLDTSSGRTLLRP